MFAYFVIFMNLEHSVFRTTLISTFLCTVLSLLEPIFRNLLLTNTKNNLQKSHHHRRALVIILGFLMMFIGLYFGLYLSIALVQDF